MNSRPDSIEKPFFVKKTFFLEKSGHYAYNRTVLSRHETGLRQMLDHRYRIRDEIAWRKMKDGTVTIVSPLVEKIISINATAGVIWELLDGTRTVAVVIAALEERFGDEVPRVVLAGDVADILRDLLDRQLIEQIVDNTPR